MLLKVEFPQLVKAVQLNRVEFGLQVSAEVKYRSEATHIALTHIALTHIGGNTQSCACRQSALLHPSQTEEGLWLH